jgi:predicted dehydrogenase
MTGIMLPLDTNSLAINHMNPTLNRRQFLRTTTAASLAAASLPSALAQADKPVTVAFVGLAHIHTPNYLDLVRKRQDVKLKRVWDHDTSRAEKCSRDNGVPAAKEVDEIWSDPDIAAVVICSETNRHLDLVLAAAKSGKHMFVEKPLGINAKESYEMADAIQKAGLIFTTGYFMRTDPKHLFLKEQIASGNFGKVTRARGSNCHSGSLGGWFDTDWRWMADPKIAGVGAFGDLGTHKLDILMWLLGDVDAVTADVRSVTGRYGDCDETGEGLIQFKNGVIGTLAAGWVDVDDPVQLLISGTQGHAVIVDNALYYGSKKVPGTNSKDPYTKLPPAPPPPIQQFLDAVAGAKDRPLVTPREAAGRVAVMEAMYRGARDRKWVQVG